MNANGESKYITARGATITSRTNLTTQQSPNRNLRLLSSRESLQKQLDRIQSPGSKKVRSSHFKLGGDVPEIDYNSEVVHKQLGTNQYRLKQNQDSQFKN